MNNRDGRCGHRELSYRRKQERGPHSQRHRQWEKRYINKRPDDNSPSRKTTSYMQHRSSLPDIDSGHYGTKLELDDISDSSMQSSSQDSDNENVAAQSSIPDHCWIGEYLDKEEAEETAPSSYNAFASKIVHKNSTLNETSSSTPFRNVHEELTGNTQGLQELHGMQHQVSTSKEAVGPSVFKTSQFASLSSLPFPVGDSVSASGTLMKYDELCHALSEYRAELERKESQIKEHRYLKPRTKVYEYGHGGRKESTSKGKEWEENRDKSADRKQTSTGSFSEESRRYSDVHAHVEIESNVENYRVVLPPSTSQDIDKVYSVRKVPTISSFSPSTPHSKRDTSYVPECTTSRYLSNKSAEKGFPITVLTTNYRQRQDSLKEEEDNTGVEATEPESFRKNPAILNRDKPPKIKPILKMVCRMEHEQGDAKELISVTGRHSENDAFSGRFNDTRKVLLDDAEELVARHSVLSAPRIVVKSDEFDSNYQSTDSGVDEHSYHFVSKTSEQDETETTEDGFPFLESLEDDESDDDQDSKRPRYSRSRSPSDGYVRRSRTNSGSSIRSGVHESHFRKVLPLGRLEHPKRKLNEDSNHNVHEFKINRRYKNGDTEGIVCDQRSSSRHSWVSQQMREARPPEESKYFQTYRRATDGSTQNSLNDASTRFVERSFHTNVAPDLHERESHSPIKWERYLFPCRSQRHRVKERSLSPSSPRESNGDRFGRFKLERNLVNKEETAQSLTNTELTHVRNIEEHPVQTQEDREDSRIFRSEESNRKKIIWTVPPNRKVIREESSEGKASVNKANRTEWKKEYERWFQRNLYPTLVNEEQARELGLHDATVFLDSVTKGNRRSMSYIPRGETAKEMLRYISLNKSAPVSTNKETLKHNDGTPSRSDANNEDCANVTWREEDVFLKRIAIVKPHNAPFDTTRDHNRQQDNLLFVIDRRPSPVLSQVPDAKSLSADGHKCEVPKQAVGQSKTRHDEKTKIEKEEQQCFASGIQTSRAHNNPTDSSKYDFNLHKRQKPEFRSWQDGPVFSDRDNEQTISSGIKNKDEKFFKTHEENPESVNVPPQKSSMPHSATNHRNYKVKNETPVEATQDRTNPNAPKSPDRLFGSNHNVMKKLDKSATDSNIATEKSSSCYASKTAPGIHLETRHDYVHRKSLSREADKKSVTDRNTDNGLEIKAEYGRPCDQSRTAIEKSQRKTGRTNNNEGTVMEKGRQRRSHHPEISSQKYSLKKAEFDTKSLVLKKKEGRRSRELVESKQFRNTMLHAPYSSSTKCEPPRPASSHDDGNKASRTPPLFTSGQQKVLPLFKRQVEKSVLRNLNVLYTFEKYRTSKIINTAKDILHAINKLNKYANFTIDHALHEIRCLFEDPTKDVLDDVKRQLRRVGMEKPCFNVDFVTFLLFQKAVFKLCYGNLNPKNRQPLQDAVGARYVRTCSEYIFPQFDGEAYGMMKLWWWRERMYSKASFYNKDQNMKPFGDDRGNHESLEDRLAIWLLDSLKQPLYNYPDNRVCGLVYEVKRQLMKRKAHATKEEAVTLIMRAWVKNYFKKIRKSLEIISKDGQQQSSNASELIVLDEVYSDESDTDDDKGVFEGDVPDDSSSLASVQVIDLF